MKVIAAVACPVCGQMVRESATRDICLAHCDMLGHACPMSGQPLGSVVQSHIRFEEPYAWEMS